MIALDSSVAIAAFASWHDRHEAAADVLNDNPRLVGHAAIETYSVLTRLPPPHRAPAPVVGEFLASNFPGPLLTLPEEAYRDLVTTLPQLGIVGGAVYDALVAASAMAAGASLVSLDRRAASTYRSIDADFELL